jgi:hypothetical protein
MEDAVEASTLREWEKEFESAARRPLEQRMRYRFDGAVSPVVRRSGRLPGYGRV